MLTPTLPPDLPIPGGRRWGRASAWWKDAEPGSTVRGRLALPSRSASGWLRPARPVRLSQDGPPGETLARTRLGCHPRRVRLHGGVLRLPRSRRRPGHARCGGGGRGDARHRLPERIVLVVLVGDITEQRVNLLPPPIARLKRRRCRRDVDQRLIADGSDAVRSPRRDEHQGSLVDLKRFGPHHHHPSASHDHIGRLLGWVRVLFLSTPRAALDPGDGEVLQTRSLRTRAGGEIPVHPDGPSDSPPADARSFPVLLGPQIRDASEAASWSPAVSSGLATCRSSLPEIDHPGQQSPSTFQIRVGTERDPQPSLAASLRVMARPLNQPKGHAVPSRASSITWAQSR
jgi:hypothetical protein